MPEVEISSGDGRTGFSMESSGGPSFLEQVVGELLGEKSPPPQKSAEPVQIEMGE
jgi:hypothetical protein